MYPVAPHDERWAVRLEGSPTLSFETDERDDAIAQASSYVRQLGAGRIVVPAETGQIETVHTYDQLPAPESSWLEAVWSRPLYVGIAAASLVALGIGLSRKR